VTTLSFESVQNSTVLSRPGGTYYNLQGRVALWNLSKMEVALDQDAKEQEMAVTDVKQENKLALGVEYIHKLEQLGTDRDSTRTKQAL